MTARLRAALRPLLLELQIAYYRRASAQIHPLHPDVALVTLTLRDLLAERDGRTQCLV